MLKKVEEVVERGRKEDRTIPVEDMEDGTGESEIGGLNDLCGPKLEDRVDSEDNLKKGESLHCQIVLKDTFTSNSEEGGELGGEG